MSYDPATDRGKVRLVISDTNTTDPTFTDTEIDTFLDLETSVRRAAAMALDVIASNETLVQKRIRLLDLQTDGPAVAKDLRAHAAQLRADDDRADDLDDAGFDIAEMITTDFARREHTANLYLEAG